MNHTHQAIVISTIRYKDNSFICRMFLEHHGLKTFIVQSAKSGKNARTNLLQPLSLVEFEAAIRENVQIHRLKDLRISKPLPEIYFNPIKSTMVIFLDEILSKTIPDDYVNDKLYHFLFQALIMLDDAMDERNFHLWCLLEISRHYGFYPYQESELPEFFDLHTAAFVSQPPHHAAFLEGEYAKALLELLDKPWYQVQPMALHSSIRKSLLEALVQFLKLHLDNLKEIKSLSILHQVFH
jgi:DNA repair protein RecO (recombination protein O)